MDRAWPGRICSGQDGFPSDPRLPESKKYLVLLRLFLSLFGKAWAVSARSPPAGQYNASDHGCISVSDDTS
jgi:hypothetical protein